MSIIDPDEFTDLDDLLTTQASDTEETDQNDEELEQSGLEELDELLDESLQADREKKKYQEDLKARKRNFSGMSAAEVAFCNSRMAAFEVARIWRPVENLAVFTRFICQACGDDKLIFTRYMQAQIAYHNPATKRWATIDKPTSTLPTRTAVEERQVPLCAKEAVMMGLDTHTMLALSEVLHEHK